jgi:hypothetical protein
MNTLLSLRRVSATYLVGSSGCFERWSWFFCTARSKRSSRRLITTGESWSGWRSASVSARGQNCQPRARRTHVVERALATGGVEEVENVLLLRREPAAEEPASPSASASSSSGTSTTVVLCALGGAAAGSDVSASSRMRFSISCVGASGILRLFPPVGSLGICIALRHCVARVT